MADNRWNPDDYDGDHDFVYEYGADVLDLLAPAAGEWVLDLGCGTGHLTAEIAEAVGPEGRVVGLDRSAEMLREARATYPDLAVVRADARAFAAGPVDATGSVDAAGSADAVSPADAGGPADTDGPFDAVFSNAALHWIPDQAAVVETVRDLLGPGGRFVAEMGGRGNVGRIIEAVERACEERGYAVEDPWYFPSVGGQATLLEERGFEVTYARLFDRPTDLAGGAEGLREWLGMFGDSLLAPLGPGDREVVVGEVEDRLRGELYDEETETWTADYRRLRFVARLEE